MEPLKDWVKSLVLLVLLASVLEMLLPMNGMKKYVRMTMGLLVVLAITRPIMGLLGQNVEVDFSAWQEERSGLPGIEEIMADAARFRERNEALAVTEAKAKVEAEALAAAKAVKGVAGAQATVDLTARGSDLKLVGVTVGVQTDTQPGVRPVEPVRPVRIEIGGARTGGSAGPASGNGGGDCDPLAAGPPGDCTSVSAWGSSSMTAAEQALADAVRQEVARRLGIPAENQMIRVVVNGGK